MSQTALGIEHDCQLSAAWWNYTDYLQTPQLLHFLKLWLTLNCPVSIYLKKLKTNITEIKYIMQVTNNYTCSAYCFFFMAKQIIEKVDDSNSSSRFLCAVFSLSVLVWSRQIGLNLYFRKPGQSFCYMIISQSTILGWKYLFLSCCDALRCIAHSVAS